jgi:hypothetical protein
VYPQGESAQPLTGASRGWADASIGTILTVTDAGGMLLVDIDPGGSDADQAAWAALGDTITAHL